ncbi:type II secretion system protein M [Psychromonas aquimarina]|uniref:type II secretion system protein M n=1 Tax=Psychromonas aquimarina TaxID=444919 RepID=UPI00040708D9|nr:type II secretion system protein M [Psychromonas aquimarina]
MVEQFKAWWQSISEREQRLFSITGAFLLLAVIYWGAWKPLVTQLEKNKAQLVRAEQTLAWVEDKAAVLRKAGVADKKKISSRLNLTQIITRSAKQQGITFSRIVDRKGRIEVSVNDVEFNRFVSWLTVLSNQYSVSVINSDISKTDKKGYIKIHRLLLGY